MTIQRYTHPRPMSEWNEAPQNAPGVQSGAIKRE